MNDKQISDIVSAHGGGFVPAEFLPGRENLTKKIIEHMAMYRNWHGYPTQITSAYRTTGSHVYGTAIDYLIWKQWRKTQPDPMQIWNIATTYPWHGVGIYFDWRDGIGLHSDLVAFSQRQRPLRWMRVDFRYYYQRPDGFFYDEDGRRKSLEQEIKSYKDLKF